MEDKTVTVDLRVADELFVVENVPATVCGHCGERVFTPEITRRLQSLAKQRKEPSRTLTVPVFSLEQSSL